MRPTITAPPIATSVGYPWALVSIRPGRMEGKRPPTQLKYLVKAHVVDGNITHYSSIRPHPDGTWTKTKCRVEPEDVLRTWRHRPHEATIKQVKRALKPITNTQG